MGAWGAPCATVEAELVLVFRPVPLRPPLEAGVSDVAGVGGVRELVVFFEESEPASPGFLVHLSHGTTPAGMESDPPRDPQMTETRGGVTTRR